MYTCVYAYIPQNNFREFTRELPRVREFPSVNNRESVRVFIGNPRESIARIVREFIIGKVVFMEIAERYTVYFEKRFQ